MSANYSLGPFPDFITKHLYITNSTTTTPLPSQINVNLPNLPSNYKWTGLMVKKFIPAIPLSNPLIQLIQVGINEVTDTYDINAQSEVGIVAALSPAELRYDTNFEEWYDISSSSQNLSILFLDDLFNPISWAIPSTIAPQCFYLEIILKAVLQEFMY
jgi:hypothetical protein